VTGQNGVTLSIQYGLNKMKSQTLAGDMRTDGVPRSKLLSFRLFAFLLFLTLGAGVEGLLFEYRQERIAELKAANLMLVENIRARLEGELNAVFYFSNGIASSWATQRVSTAPEKAHYIFANLLRHSRHVRSFAVAVGTRIAYVYPPGDSGMAIDSDLKNHLLQWPFVERGIATRSPQIIWTGPPARGGLAYLVPIFEKGQFWGLLSTQIDESSLFTAAGLTQKNAAYQYALRGKGLPDAKEGMILGSSLLFGDPQAQVLDLSIPGGHWQLAVKSGIEPMPGIGPWFLRLMGWLLAALFAALAMASRKLQQKLAEMALYDPLTELPSRNLFIDRLVQVIRRTKRNRGNFSILFINLNEFKSINESHGEKVGDMMLAGIGKRISGFIRHCDTVTRWVGDEFLILLDDCPHDQAHIIAANLGHQIELPVHCGEHPLKIGASIGLATFPDDGQSLAALLKVAEARMVEEKGQRKI
jgi:diguanylate cyclase (GGDEF)-like protein